MGQSPPACLFRTFERASESEMDPTVTEALANPTTRLCHVGNCALTGQHLYDYMMAFGRVDPREALDAVVAPSCTMLDVPHDSDRDIARLYEEHIWPAGEQ